MTIEPMLRDLMNKFNEKVDGDENLWKELNGMSKKVLVDLESETYHFNLRDSKIQDFEAGISLDPDIIIQSDPVTFQELIEGKMKPMKAFALRKVKVKGEIDDILKLRKLF